MAKAPFQAHRFPRALREALGSGEGRTTDSSSRKTAESQRALMLSLCCEA